MPSLRWILVQFILVCIQESSQFIWWLSVGSAVPPGVDSRVTVGSCFLLSEDGVWMQAVGDGFVFSAETTFSLYCDRTINWKVTDLSCNPGMWGLYTSLIRPFLESYLNAFRSHLLSRCGLSSICIICFSLVIWLGALAVIIITLGAATLQFGTPSWA